MSILRLRVEKQKELTRKEIASQEYSDICNQCGQCCEAFILFGSPETLEKHRIGKYRNDEVAQTIINMVVYLGYWDNKFWYTCKNYKKGKGCLIYANRPDMCSRFPYGSTALYKGCAYPSHETLTPQIVKRNLTD